MVRWNLAELYEGITDRMGDEAAIIDGNRVFTWAELDRRADTVAADMLAHGLGQGARVGVCTTNRAAYLESYFACFKAGLVPFNINYRYTADELAYLLDNADAEAVVVEGAFAASMAEACRRTPSVGRAYLVNELPAPAPAGAPAGATAGVAAGPGAGGGIGADAGLPGAVAYEDIATGNWPGRTVAPWGRSPGDLIFQYTGGTTGHPKAVMWRHDDLVDLLAGTGSAPGQAVLTSDVDILANLRVPAQRSHPAAPLMHGTGFLSQLTNMMSGGCTILAEGTGFDAAATWDAVQRHRANVIIIVGDVFARALVAELERTGPERDLSSLGMIVSSGAMWSQLSKEALLVHLPGITLLDAFGSSEASGLGKSFSTATDVEDTASFKIGERARVLADDGTWVEPGSGIAGRVAMSAPIAMGYHKDPERTAATFPVIDGVRYSIPGDYALVEADGSLTLLGRGSACINTGGEKVYPEEVEEVLKEHESVADAACLGVPDERFGQAVCALVEGAAGVTVDTDAVVAHVKQRLARYKAPRHVIVVPSLQRLPNGKLDRRILEEIAQRELATRA